MTDLILLAALLCPKTIIESPTSEPWSEVDQAALEKATTTCRDRYHGCLKRFIRVKARQYQAICKKQETK